VPGSLWLQALLEDALSSAEFPFVDNLACPTCLLPGHYVLLLFFTARRYASVGISCHHVSHDDILGGTKI